MRFNKKMVVLAAAGALSVATALPAMALENEFHGMFAFKTFLSNFDNGSSNSTFQTPNVKSTMPKKSKSNNYAEQRTRIQYTAKASDDLKLVTHFEMNTRFGNEVSGGDIDTDGNNLVVKHAYLDFNVVKPLNVKLGQMAYKDTIKGLYVDADLPMILTTTRMGAYTLGLGYSRFNDTGARLGDAFADLFVLDNTYALSKSTKVALSYYLNADNANAAKSKNIHTLGLSGESKVGPATVSGFAAVQAGHQRNFTGTQSKQFHGWAANLAAKMAVGPGTAKTGFLFTSGNNSSSNSHDKGWQTLSAAGSTTSTGAVQNSYNESGMMLLARNTSMGGTSSDAYLRKPVTNIALYNLGYDANLTQKTFLNSNVGFAWVPASNPGSAAKPTNGSDFLGTEINAELGHKLYTNLTLKAQAAYVILGSATKGLASDSSSTVSKDPDNPYSVRLQATYAF